MIFSFIVCTLLKTTTMYYCFFILKKNLKLVSCFLAFSFFSAISCHAQSDPDQITQLLTERDNLLSQSQSTLEIDKQLFNLGYRPKAQVTIIGNGFTFPLFLPVSPTKQAVMESRIKSVCPFLLTLQLNEQDQSIIAQLSETPTPAMILDIIIHFGFEAYENN